MQFAGWYLKIAAVGASIGAAMELFMIHTGFYAAFLLSCYDQLAFCTLPQSKSASRSSIKMQFTMKLMNESYISLWFYTTDEKVTVLESEKRAWESSAEAQAMREALNPWRKHDEQQQEK
ncbi:hypothetical protein PR202_ga25007 [Eleusine coracana subsp. coracana]|uniref:Uncharacterized protein n=1 Tax=Eleusine coracana subsp. coracana TaxID=191504 RepID=A0AAV5D8E0_ELECO|nr:hypothetical protein PR202_ga25007 [Eleusine coracana subsp. coracana]